MLFEDVKVSPEFIKYHEEKFKQKSRLHEPTPFYRHHLRFVSSPSTLSVGYYILPDSGIKIPKLALPKKMYEKLRKIGTFVKVFLGYLKHSDRSANASASFTPEGTNVLIPYVSSIVQWKADSPPELVPCGFFRKEQTSPIIVLLSGNQGKDHQERISKFYNHIYRDSIEDDNIEVFSADNIADMYIPYLLKGMVAAKKAEPFTMIFCAKEVIEKKLKPSFSYVENPVGKEQKAQNSIYCILDLLKLLIQDKNCMTRHDTVCKLRIKYPTEINDDVPSKNNGDKFNEFIINFKDELMEVAFKEMKYQIEKFDRQELKEVFNKWKKYLEWVLFPSNFDTIEKAQSFWLFILGIGEDLQCSNPDGVSKINVVKRLYKECFPASENHTERLLIGLLRTKPQSILGNLKEIFDSKKSDGKNPLIVAEGYPKYLGIIVDSFSWLDVCNSCSDFLNTNDVWTTTLQNLRPIIKEYKFNIPSEKIDSLFRFVSQDQYPTTTTTTTTTTTYNSVPPLDLTDAGGGSTYTESGWEFRLLSEERVCLATRYNVQETLVRDRVIEGIQNKLIESISTYKPLSFYTSDWLWHILNMDRPFCKNALFLLQAYNDENKALLIYLSQKLLGDRCCYRLLRPMLLETTNELIKQEKYAKIFLSGNISESPHEYARVYFGTGCIEKIKMVGTKSVGDIENYIIDFSKYCRVYKSRGTSRSIGTGQTPTLNEAIKEIINHWENNWRKGTKKVDYDKYNYEADDKAITRSMVDILEKVFSFEQIRLICDALNQLQI